MNKVRIKAKGIGRKVRSGMWLSYLIISILVLFLGNNLALPKALSQPRVILGDWTVEFPALDVQGDEKTCRAFGPTFNCEIRQDFLNRSWGLLKASSYVNTHWSSESHAITPIRAARTLDLSGSPLGWNVTVNSNLTGDLSGNDRVLGGLRPEASVTGNVSVNPSNFSITHVDSFIGSGGKNVREKLKTTLFRLFNGKYTLETLLTTRARINACFTCTPFPPTYAESNFMTNPRSSSAYDFGFYVDIFAAPISSVIACGDTNALIQAIEGANLNPAADPINLNPNNQIDCTYTLTADYDARFGGSGLPPITSEITVNGNGATIERSRTAGTPNFRIFVVDKGGHLILRNLTVRNGQVSLYGGCIANIGGKLSISNSTVSNCFAGTAGGGISNDVGSQEKKGIVTIEHSIVVNNHSSFSGGGITNEATMAISNTTIAQNISDESGGIDNFKGTLTITNSTIAKNKSRGVSGGAPFSGGLGVYGTVNLQNTVLSENTGGNCGTFGNNPIQITSLGYNLNHELAKETCELKGTGDRISYTAGLGSFMDPGIPGGARFPLLVNSPAIDAGACIVGTDQLGRPRAVDGKLDSVYTPICDIGAVEFYPTVNNLLNYRQSELFTQYDPTPVPGAPAGVYTIKAKFDNKTNMLPASPAFDPVRNKPIFYPFAEVIALQLSRSGAAEEDQPVLMNADGGPGRVGARLTPPGSLIAPLNPGATATLQFKIGLKKREKFIFYINMLGEIR